MHHSGIKLEVEIFFDETGKPLDARGGISTINGQTTTIPQLRILAGTVEEVINTLILSTTQEHGNSEQVPDNTNN